MVHWWRWGLVGNNIDNHDENNNNDDDNDDDDGNDDNGSGVMEVVEMMLVSKW